MCAAFRSHQAFKCFADAVMRKSRYFPDAETADFLGVILETSKSRQVTLASGQILWRAQIGSDWYPRVDGDGLFSEQQPSPLDQNRMKPLRDRAKEGRANPKGMPYLYLATLEATAIAEVRPWVGADVTIARFRALRELRLVNTVAKDRTTMVYSYEPEPEERERAVWLDMDHAFSRPVTVGEDTADYVPTQVLAEFFKTNHLDGIAYGSSLGKGQNIVLFDINVAEQIQGDLVNVTGVRYIYDLAANPYFVGAHPLFPCAETDDESAV
jgi:RES domain